MAVLVEAISVVIKAQAIVDRYPGGWPRFEANPPNGTLCADGELIRVGFMVPDDVKDFIDRLSQFGIEYIQNGKCVDLAVADQQRGFAAPCDWAEFRHGPLGGDKNKRVAGCSLIGSRVLELVTPDGWQYENSLSSKFQFVESGKVTESMKFLRQENGLDVYKDLTTGKEVFVGRTSQSQSGLVSPIRLPENSDPKKLEACRAYARMMNTLDYSHIVFWLADDFRYTSQWVMEDMTGKRAYIEYIKGKLKSIKRSGSQVWAEIAYTDAFGAGPLCCAFPRNAGRSESHAVGRTQGRQDQSNDYVCRPIPPGMQKNGRAADMIDGTHHNIRRRQNDQKKPII